MKRDATKSWSPPGSAFGTSSRPTGIRQPPLQRRRLVIRGLQQSDCSVILVLSYALSTGVVVVALLFDQRVPYVTAIEFNEGLTWPGRSVYLTKLHYHTRSSCSTNRRADELNAYRPNICSVRDETTAYIRSWALFSRRRATTSFMPWPNCGNGITATHSSSPWWTPSVLLRIRSYRPGDGGWPIMRGHIKLNYAPAGLIKYT